MGLRFAHCLGAVACCLSLLVWGQAKAKPRPIPSNGGDFSNNTQALTKVPTGEILVKGAWSSASDTVTPLPEGGRVTNSVFRNQYFGMTYLLSKNWGEKYKGPPPSDSGRYVLAQLTPASVSKGASRASILIMAQDMFFTLLPAANALQLVSYQKASLPADYRVEMPPTQTTIAGRPFAFFAYWSPVAQLHWYILATQIRCHAVELVLTSRDTKLLQSLVLDMNKMTLPAEAGPTLGTGGGAAPSCLKDYVNSGSLVARVDPVFAQHRFNPVPLRIIINKAGKVKHIHFLSAFPDQVSAITDALKQWRFRPYLKNGQLIEVETGIMFGRAPPPATLQAARPATE